MNHLLSSCGTAHMVVPGAQTHGGQDRVFGAWWLGTARVLDDVVHLLLLLLLSADGYLLRRGRLLKRNLVHRRVLVVCMVRLRHGGVGLNYLRVDDHKVLLLLLLGCSSSSCLV